MQCKFFNISSCLGSVSTLIVGLIGDFSGLYMVCWFDAKHLNFSLKTTDCFIDEKPKKPKNIKLRCNMVLSGNKQVNFTSDTARGFYMIFG
jgi:hypothetical protein